MSRILEAKRVPRVKGIDLRIKADENDKTLIRVLYPILKSTRLLASIFKVSRRLIQRIIDPVRDEIMREQRKENGKKNNHYNGTKEYHRQSVQRHRHHKRDLINKGVI